jgi:hypothetical protein
MVGLGYCLDTAVILGDAPIFQDFFQLQLPQTQSTLYACEWGEGGREGRDGVCGNILCVCACWGRGIQYGSSLERSVKVCSLPL